jgi:hypothetical protein
VSSDSLEYHYDISVADEDHGAGTLGGKAASEYRFDGYTGQLDLKNDISISLVTGQYTEFHRVDVDFDIFAEEHVIRVYGRCTSAGFTPFPSQPG